LYKLHIMYYEMSRCSQITPTDINQSFNLRKSQKIRVPRV